MVRTYRRSQQKTDDDTPATKQSIADLQAQIATLVTTVTNLITQRTAPAIRMDAINMMVITETQRGARIRLLQVFSSMFAVSKTMIQTWIKSMKIWMQNF